MSLIDEALLDKFRNKVRCERCGVRRQPDMLLDPHHLLCRGQGQSQRVDIAANLIALCRFCHTSAEYDWKIGEQVRGIVGLREGLTWDQIQNLVWLARRTSCESS